MLGEEQAKTPDQPMAGQPNTDAGAEARANDIIEALVETKAWQDSERKAAAEAEQVDRQV